MPIYKQNHDIDLQEMQEKFKSFPEMFYSEDWKISTKKNGVEISVFEGETYTGIKGSIELPYNNEVVGKVLNQPEIPFKANVFHDHLDILQTCENSIILYMRFKGFLMVAGRDFITLNTSTYMYDENSQSNGLFLISLDAGKTPVLISYSSHHPDGPSEAQKGTVRGEIVSVGVFIFR
jgi:hypothetical protein